MNTLLGCKLSTDWPPLEKLLKDIESGNESEEQMEVRFPGMLAIVFKGMCSFAERRLTTGLILYRNFRIQLWPTDGFDADPTIPIRCLPAGVDPGW